MIEITTKIQMLVGTIIILVYLIVIELLTAKHEEAQQDNTKKEVFYPIIFALIMLFVAILIRNVMDVLK